jgi:Ca-activated chloride channel family protein
MGVFERLVVVATGLALTAGPLGAAEPARAIELVVDASVATSTTLTDGHSRIDAIRRAVAHALLQLPQDGSEGSVSLHLLGSSRAWWSDSACEDVTEVPADQPVDHARLIAAIDGLHPTGSRSLEAALGPILDRLRETDAESVRVVLVLANDTDCPDDRVRLLETIEAAGDRLELRVVGVGMPHAVATAFDGHITVRNAWNQKDLVSAIDEAVRGVGARRPRRSAVEIVSPATIPPDLVAEMVGPSGDEPDPLRVDGQRITGRMLPGRYTLRVVTPEGDVVAERGPIDVVAGADLRIELPPPPNAPASLEVTPERPLVGSTAWVRRWGAPAPGSVWSVTVARADAPPHGWEVRSIAGDADTEVAIVVPEALSGPYELRVLEGPPGGPWSVVGARPWEPARPAVLIEVPEALETGTPLAIAWKGPAFTGDRIEIARTDPPATASSACVRVLEEEGEAAVRAPSEPGTYRVRYMLGPVHAVATTRTVELFEILARLDAPATAASGADVDVRWEGPAEPHDFIAIARADDPDDAYGPWAPVGSGSPTVLTAPREPGPWEIRYVAGASGAVLARAPLIVEELGISIGSPTRVTAGTRFDVTWAGTAAPGDIIVVAPLNSPTSRIIDWAATDAGSPVSLAAPFAPGAFEIRFVRPATRDVLAARPLEVVE